MSIRIGTSLGALSMDQLNPRRKENPNSGGVADRILNVAQIKELQERQKHAKLNSGKRKSDDMDDFFLKFTEHRESGISNNVTKMAKVMNDSKDSHIITANSDSGVVENKRLADKFSIDLADMSELNIEAKGDIPLSDKQIQKLKETYDVHSLTEKEGVELLIQLTQTGALSYNALINSLPVAANKEDKTDYLAAQKKMVEDLENLAQQMEAGEAFHLGGRELSAKEVRETADAHRQIVQAIQQLANPEKTDEIARVS